MFAKRLDRQRFAHINDVTRNLEYEHQIKPMIGKPLSLNEDVELNNRLIEETNNFLMTGQLSKKTIELLDRVPYDYRSYLLQSVGSSALQKKVVRNNKVELKDINAQKKFESMIKIKESKHDPINTRNEHITSLFHYNQRYDNSGMRR